jgi:hypothetical protein
MPEGRLVQKEYDSIEVGRSEVLSYFLLITKIYCIHCHNNSKQTIFGFHVYSYTKILNVIVHIFVTK